MNCSLLPWAITIRKIIIAQTTPRTNGDIFWETSFIEVFRINQWQIKSIVISENTLMISKLSIIFSPSSFRKNIEVIMFFATENSLALKNTQVKLTSV